MILEGFCDLKAVSTAVCFRIQTLLLFYQISLLLFGCAEVVWVGNKHDHSHSSACGDASSGGWKAPINWLLMNFPLTKQVFMKEAERQMLQDTLHKEVIRKIILLQSWLRMVLERRRFLRTRQAAIVLQVSLRTACLLFLTNPLKWHSPPSSIPPLLEKSPSLGLLAFPLC